MGGEYEARDCAAAVVVFTGLAMAQQPYAGLQDRSIKTLSDQQIADLNAGRGMGLALAAELNGYPGPIHTIELADELHLSPEQVAKLKALFEAMKAETIPLGSCVNFARRDLNNDFANRTITLANLEATTQRIGATQAALRAAHLKYHLSTVAILTPEQVARYNELRGYKAEEGANAGPSSNASVTVDRWQSVMMDYPAEFFQGTEMPTAGWWEALWPDPAGVLAAVGLRSGMDVIDLCSGDGWFTLQIAKVARHVSAIDIDPPCWRLRGTGSWKAV